VVERRRHGAVGAGQDAGALRGGLGLSHQARITVGR
jgi:hypothetical protein